MEFHKKKSPKQNPVKPCAAESSRKDTTGDNCRTKGFVSTNCRTGVNSDRMDLLATRCFGGRRWKGFS